MSPKSTVGARASERAALNSALAKVCLSLSPEAILLSAQCALGLRVPMTSVTGSAVTS